MLAPEDFKWTYLEGMPSGGAQIMVKWYGTGDRVIATSRKPSRVQGDAVYAKGILFAYDAGSPFRRSQLPTS